MDASSGVARSTTPRQSDESYQNSGPENLSEPTDTVDRQNEAKCGSLAPDLCSPLFTKLRSSF